jgi:hypothetical protein
MFGKLAACASAGMLILSASQFAEAKTQTIRNPELTIKAGKKTSLQDLYAWDKNCRPLSISFRPGTSSKGKLYVVNDRFRVNGAPKDPCNGKSVSGKRVIFEANPGFTGKTTVSYSVKTPNYPDTFLFTRPIRVR